MKIKFFGIIAMTAVMVCAMAACGGSGGGDDGSGKAKWIAVKNTTFGNTSVNQVIWGKDKFIAAGGIYSGETAKMAYSPNGITWTAVPLAGTAFDDYKYIRKIAWGNNMFVAVGSDYNTMASSPDGITWTDITGLRSYGDIAWGNNTFIAVGSNDAMAYSSDGITWTEKKWSEITDISFHTYNHLRGISWVNDRFIVWYQNKMAYSMDGDSWTEITDSPFVADYHGITHIVYGNGKYVAAGDFNRIAYSSNGVTWTRIKKEFANLTMGVAFGNNRFVLVESLGRTYTSTNGVSWTEINGAFNWKVNGAYCIGWGNNKFITGGREGNMAYWLPGK